MSAREAVCEDVLQRIAEEQGVETMALDWAIVDYIVEGKHEVAIERARERIAKARNILTGKVPIDDPGHRSLAISAIRRTERQAQKRIKRARKARAKDKKRGFTPAVKPHGLRGRLAGVSLAQGKDGQFFVYTHRARSKSYPEPGKIPLKAVRFIRSTG